MNIYYLNIMFLIVFLPIQLQFRYTDIPDVMLRCDGGAMQDTKKAGPDYVRAKLKKSLPPTPASPVYRGVQLVLHPQVVREEVIELVKAHYISPAITSINCIQHIGNNSDFVSGYLDAFNQDPGGYQLTWGADVQISHGVSVVLTQKQDNFEARSMPRVNKMSFTEASTLSRELSDSRKERLMRASFDGPE